MKIYSGTSGFAYKAWKGTFYPEKISPKEMLRFYSGRLNTVEINNTFYHMPTTSVLTSWADQVGEEFLFALKAPQRITHLKRLKNVDDETEYLFRSLKTLGGKLGPVLFQFPKSFRPHPELLRDFLELIPAGALCAFEFRNPGWLEGEVPDLLRGKGCSLCIAEDDDEPAGQVVSTAPWGYLRLRRSDYSNADLSAWAEKVLSQHWDRAFVFFKHEDGAKGPGLAQRFQELVDPQERPLKTGTTGS